MQAHPDHEVVGIICAHNEQENIERAVRTLGRAETVDRVVVVDGHSDDQTWRRAESAGAHVVAQRQRRYPGKGVAMQTALEETDEEVLVFFDADIHNMEPWQPDALVRGVLCDGADHAMARFTRKGGRVTELTAKPLLRILFPEIRYHQPLTGEFASRRVVLEQVDVVPDWGVESGLVIDLTMMGANIVEVDTGSKEHPMKPLPELTQMADQVARTIVDKAIAHGRLQRIIELEKVAKTERMEEMTHNGLATVSL